MSPDLLWGTLLQPSLCWPGGAGEESNMSREGPSEKPEPTIARIPLLLVVPGSAQQVIQRTVCYRMWGKIIGWSRTWGSFHAKVFKTQIHFYDKMTMHMCLFLCDLFWVGFHVFHLVQGELRRWPIYNSGVEAQRTWRRDSRKTWREYGRENFSSRENKTQNL